MAALDGTPERFGGWSWLAKPECRTCPAIDRPTFTDNPVRLFLRNYSTGHGANLVMVCRTAYG